MILWNSSQKAAIFKYKRRMCANLTVHLLKIYSDGVRRACSRADTGLPGFPHVPVVALGLGMKGRLHLTGERVHASRASAHRLDSDWLVLASITHPV